VLFPNVHKFAVVIYRLKNRRVRQHLLQAACAHAINFFLVWVRKNLHELFFALGAVVGSIHHLFRIFNQNFYAVMRSPV
jgi:hypothetical protein